MDARNTNYRPVKFVDGLEKNKHIVLLYENEEYADLIIARYFLDGLEKGESCIFFTSDEHDPIEKRLSSEGIDVDHYKKSGQLRIYLVRAPSNSGPVDPLTILKGIRADATRGMNGPYRFAGRTIPDIESENGMLAGMSVERTGQQHFAEFDNSQMCFYDISKLEKTRRNEWISALVKNHDHVIYASSPEKAVAFDATLLEEEE